MAGRPKSATAPTRYLGVQVMTSIVGTQLPVGWGTTRVKSSVVWYNNFKSQAQHQGSGKGGHQTTTGYTYTADLILGLVTGPIAGIGNSYISGAVYATPGQTGFSISNGALGQPVWPYLASNYPSQALGYSRLAIAYASNYLLDSSASVPNIGFEVKFNVSVPGLPDANPKDILTDWFNDPTYGPQGWAPNLLGDLTQYGNYCLAANLLLSPLIDQERTGLDFLTEVMTSTNSNCLWSEGVLKIIPYGDVALTGNGATYTPNLTPVYSLNDDSWFTANDDDDPLIVEVSDQSDAYNITQVEFLSRANNYNSSIATAQDTSNISQFGRRIQDPVSLHAICDPQVAQNACQLLLQRTLYIRGTYKFSLPWNYALLEPGDLLNITDAGLGLTNYPVRITQIDTDEDRCLDLTCEDLLAGVSNAPIYNHQDYAATTFINNVDPGSVDSNLLIRSETFTTGWFLTNVTITPNVLADPLTGGNNASRLIPTVTNGQHQISFGVQNYFPNTNYTASLYVKAGTWTQITLLVNDGGNTAYATWDLSTGQEIGHAGGALFISDSIQGPFNVTPPGWYRVALTFQMLNASCALYIRVMSNNQSSFPGDGTTGIYIYGAQVTQGVDVRTYSRTLGAINGPMLFNPPVGLTAGVVQTWAAVCGGPNWGGANVWVSYDSTTYTQVGVINADSRYGYLTSAMSLVADPDSTSTIAIDLSSSGGSLVSASQAAANAGGSLCLVDPFLNQGGELIDYTTVTNTGQSLYNLSGYTRRGVLNSVAAGHANAAAFIRIDDCVFHMPYLRVAVGASCYVKFQSFNLKGQGVQPLANCVAYRITPYPVQTRGPGGTAWTVQGATVVSGGVQTPVLQINGASDNPSAQGVEFYYRITGTSAWNGTGLCANTITQRTISGIAANQAYDVAVAYLANGVMTALVIIGSAITSGGGGASGGVGSTLLDDPTPGVGKTFTCPAGSYGHVDIVLVGQPGAGNGTFSGSKSLGYTETDYGGGGAMSVVVKTFTVTPGTTVLTYTLPSGATNATCTATGLNLNAKPGANATASAAGAGATAGGTNTATSGTVTVYVGHNGGLTNYWDGGGAANLNGVYTDNTTANSNGTLPGQAGSGASASAGGPNAGGGPRLTVIARA